MRDKWEEKRAKRPVEGGAAGVGNVGDSDAVSSAQQSKSAVAEPSRADEPREDEVGGEEEEEGGEEFRRAPARRAGPGPGPGRPRRGSLRERDSEREPETPESWARAGGRGSPAGLSGLGT